MKCFGKTYLQDMTRDHKCTAAGRCRHCEPSLKDVNRGKNCCCKHVAVAVGSAVVILGWVSLRRHRHCHMFLPIIVAIVVVPVVVVAVVVAVVDVIARHLPEVSSRAYVLNLDKLYIYINIYICTHTHTYLYVCIYIYTHICVYAYTHIFT